MTEKIKGTGEGGKGSSSRPYSVPREVYELRRTLIWGTKEQKLEARKQLIEVGEIK